MKKTVMYTETRTWFFELNLAEDADLNETMRALKDTNGFYSYVDDCTSDEYESAWHERCRTSGEGRVTPTIPRTSEL